MAKDNKFRISKKRFLRYAALKFLILVAVLLDLVLIGKVGLLTFFPILSFAIFSFLIVRFIRIALGNSKVNEYEEWFYDCYNRGCTIFIVIALLVKVF